MGEIEFIHSRKRCEDGTREDLETIVRYIETTNSTDLRRMRIEEEGGKGEGETDLIESIILKMLKIIIID